MTPHPTLAGLTPEQAAAAAESGPVLVLAGAGTGKTRTLTAAVAHRTASRGIDPGRVLFVTFTNKAAAEMLARIRTALPGGRVPHWIGTFHGLGARQLRVDPEVAGLRPGFEILDADDSRRVLRRAIKGLALPDRDAADGAARDPLKELASRIAAMKDRLEAPEDAAQQAETTARAPARPGVWSDVTGLRVTAQAYAAYQAALRDANAADFGDLLLWTTRAMLRDARRAATWASRFDSVFADEYQDVNRAQYVWLRLTGAYRQDAFAVGDDDQVLYSWRGADVGRIRRFAADFKTARPHTLEANHRSTGHILAAANAIIARAPHRYPKVLRTAAPAGVPIEIVAFPDAQAEALGIANEIALRHAEGVPWDAIAVLYRTSALSRAIEEALLRARVPYALVGDVAFWQRAEIKDALALLRLAEAPDRRQSDEAFRRICNAPPRGLGEKALQALEAEAGWRGVSLLAAIETAPLSPKARAGGLGFADAIRRVGDPHTTADRLSLLLDRTGYRAALRASGAEESEERLANIADLTALAGAFHTVRELLDHAALATGGPDDALADRVRLMTLHRAKGLEFGHVFLPGWEAGLFPADWAEDEAEERRLAYVGITRAKLRLTITRAAFRRGRGSPSPFIAEIPEAQRIAGWLRTAPAGSHAGQRRAGATAAVAR